MSTAAASLMGGSVCAFLQDGTELLFGANVSQSRAIEELQKPSQLAPFHRMADHLLRIAGMVRCLSAPGGPQHENLWRALSVHVCMLEPDRTVQIHGKSSCTHWFRMQGSMATTTWNHDNPVSTADGLVTKCRLLQNLCYFTIEVSA